MVMLPGRRRGFVRVAVVMRMSVVVRVLVVVRMTVLCGLDGHGVTVVVDSMDLLCIASAMRRIWYAA